jgi:formamidopyrimidine-DNA glycosylase
LSDDFDGGALCDMLRGKRTPMKSALLDQRLVAGLGNIYVCEILNRAGVSPKRTAATVGGAGPRATLRGERIVAATKQVLEEAIEAGGSTISDFVNVDGDLGYFSHSFRVYGREGEPCLRQGCEGVVARIVQSGRSTFFCPRCQR